MAARKTAKKKTASKKTAAKRPTAEVIRFEPNGSLLDPSAIQAAAETLMAAVEDYRAELTELPEDGELLQNHIAVARFAAFAKGAMGDMEETFAANALRLRQLGSVEDGALRVDYDLKKGGVTPKWKSEAGDQAAKVAQLKNLEFVREEYEDQVKAATKKSADKYKPIIREVS